MSIDWFGMKQAEYINSKCILTKLLSDKYSIGKNTGLNRFKDKTSYQFNEWTKGSIEKRQEILMDLALDYWKLNGKRLDEYERVSTVDNVEA